MFCAVCMIILGLVIAYVIYDKIGRTSLLDEITKRAVLITGCDSGFGAALARRLDKLGVPVFAGCLTENGRTKLQEDTSSRLKVIMMDVTKTDSIEAAYNIVKEALQPNEVLWGVVNNAGISAAGGPLEFLTRQVFQSIFEVNVFGMAEVSRIFLPLLKKSHGRLVFMTSITGVVAIPLDISYSSSKYAAEGLADVLRRTLHVWGITVHAIEPSLFRTNIVEKNLYFKKKREQWEQLPAEIREEYGEDYLTKTLAFDDNVINRADQCLDLVIDAYQHALLAKHPRLRYPVGSLAKKLSFINHFPTSLVDKMVQKSAPIPLATSLTNKE